MLMAGDRRNYFIVILCLFALVVGPVLTERVFNIASVYSTRWVVFCFELVLLAAVWVALKSKEDDGGALFSQFESRCLLAWLMLSMVSVIFSDHIAASLVRQSEWYASFGLVYFLGRYIAILPSAAKFFYAFLSLVFVFVVFRFGMLWVSVGAPREYDWFHNPPVFFHIRHLNIIGVMASVASFTFFYLRRVRYGLSFYAFLTLGFLSSFAIFWGGGRSGFICLIFLVLMNTFFLRRETRELFIFIFAWSIITCLALFFAEFFYTSSSGMGVSLFHGRDVTETTLNSASSGRVLMWISTLRELFSSYAVFGFGPDSFIYSGSKLSIAAQPHNFVVQFLGDWGVGGIVLLLFYFAAMKKSSFKYEFENDARNMLFVSWVFVATVFLLGVFDGTLYHPWSLSFFTLGFACYVGLRRVAFSGCPEVMKSQLDGWIPKLFQSSYYWVGLAVVMGLHAGVNLVQQGPVPPSPFTPRALLVKYFPSHSLVMGSWYAEWVRKYPSIGLDGLHWLQKNSISNFSWSYYMAEADYYRDNGDFDKAKELYLIALAKATVGGAKSEVQLRLDNLLSQM